MSKRVLTEEQREKVRERQRKRRKNPELHERDRERKRERQRKRRKNPELHERDRERHRELDRERRKNPEFCERERERKRERRRERRKNPELHERDRERHREQQRERRKDPKVREQKREQKLLSNYGITIVQKDLLFELQKVVCACCGTDTPTKIGWVTDHDHITGEIRGILCSRCNVGIGALGDTVEGLRKALHYLEYTAKITQLRLKAIRGE